MGEAKTHYEVIVVGAGVAGIYQIKRLVDLGIDATVLDSAAGLGAPGAGTAIPAVVLIPRATPPASRSHANWHWKERFSVRRAIRRASSGRARVPMYKRRPPARPKETDERAEPLAVHHRPRCAQKP
jgi:cation diffusion facilitator CzcD-associated flavoprotein CzcO